jgi:hypothetical protein
VPVARALLTKRDYVLYWSLTAAVAIAIGKQKIRPAVTKLNVSIFIVVVELTKLKTAA